MPTPGETMVDVPDGAPRPTRRAVLVTSAAAGTALVLPACGRAGAATVDPGVGAVAAPPAGDPVLGLTSDVPVGGAKVYAGQRVVVTQPTEGTFVGLSAVCTHQGCVVAAPDGAIACPCHGSRFHLDGAVEAGPASRPLDVVVIALQGNQIVIGAAPDPAPAAPGY
jgi:Rieske Fe-S protein